MSHQPDCLDISKKKDLSTVRRELWLNLFYPFAIIVFLILFAYFTLYEGKYKSEYFIADSNSELTELALEYNQRLSQDNEYAIQYIMYLSSGWLGFKHNASIQFVYQGETIEMEYRDEGLPPGFHAWIDLEEPESIRFYNDYLKDDRHYLSEEARAVRDSIERAHEAVQTYLENKASWKNVFQTSTDNKSF